MFRSQSGKKYRHTVREMWIRFWQTCKLWTPWCNIPTFGKFPNVWKMRIYVITHDRTCYLVFSKTIIPHMMYTLSISRSCFWFVNNNFKIFYIFVFFLLNCHTIHLHIAIWIGTYVINYSVINQYYQPVITWFCLHSRWRKIWS